MEMRNESFHDKCETFIASLRVYPDGVLGDVVDGEILHRGMICLALIHDEMLDVYSIN